MSTLLTRMSKDRTQSMVQQERDWRAHRADRKPAKTEPTPSAFWWAYALVLVAVAALWRACM